MSLNSEHTISILPSNLNSDKHAPSHDVTARCKLRLLAEFLRCKFLEKLSFFKHFVYKAKAWRMLPALLSGRSGALHIKAILKRANNKGITVKTMHNCVSRPQYT